MPILDMTFGEFKEVGDRENRQWREWENDQRRRGLLKNCKSCGCKYSSEIAFFQSGGDSGECQSCRGEEGELVL